MELAATLYGVIALVSTVTGNEPWVLTSTSTHTRQAKLGNSSREPFCEWRWREKSTAPNTSTVPSYDTMCRYMALASEMWCVRQSDCKDDSQTLSSNRRATSLAGFFVANVRRLNADTVSAAVLTLRTRSGRGGMKDPTLSVVFSDEINDSEWQAKFGAEIFDHFPEGPDKCSVSRPFFDCHDSWSVAVSAPIKCSTPIPR
jgi:hypothetical protein